MPARATSDGRTSRATGTPDAASSGVVPFGERERRRRASSQQRARNLHLEIGGGDQKRCGADEASGQRPLRAKPPDRAALRDLRIGVGASASSAWTVSRSPLQHREHEARRSPRRPHSGRRRRRATPPATSACPEKAASVSAELPSAAVSLAFAPPAEQPRADAASPLRRKQQRRAAARVDRMRVLRAVLTRRGAAPESSMTVTRRTRARVHVGTVGEQHFDDVRMLLARPPTSGPSAAVSLSRALTWRPPPAARAPRRRCRCARRP